ncbi:unnamed protein product [Hermetia illucens]|uniref:non-specific serine/threonine protein kinase n=2 Tax=Hermetia illucens TaxID=343691 RepID=A0A7R8Z214_HERIL|nr:unnamed protein product [Hermetia illucens]
MQKANTVPQFPRFIGIQRFSKKAAPRNTSLPTISYVRNASETQIDTNEELKFENYELVRTVGHGSFGVAVLYRRKSDEKYVVLKQISLNELTSQERDLAMNEVEVFSKLHHPNIINYLGNFIKNDVLYIEMQFADGGTLAQIIASRGPKHYFPERQIISIFEQITSAINYMHSENILHRDLKTANVFLCNRGRVKIGDFGISKIMNTKILAQTVLGTPYYFSPEMCEGKEYDHKSDIWALGCLLNEMCCLRKTFAASNLPELVGRIMSGQYTPVPPGYSNGLKTLLSILLQVEASRRPCASEILQYWIPLIYRNLGRNKGNAYNYDNDASEDTNESLVNTAQTFTQQLMEAVTAIPNNPLEARSVLYQLKAFGTGFSLTPLQLPPKAKIRGVATNDSHFIVVNEDGSVYSWGEGSKGQLGLNSLDSWKHYPSRIEALRKYRVIGACAGDGFSIFWTDLGVVFSCGDNSRGALGRDDQKSNHIPKVVESLNDIKIVEVVASGDHVLALDNNGLLYSWGTCPHGSLGLGNSRNSEQSPTLVPLPCNINKPVKIFCGPDASALLQENGNVYACGSNSFGKLGFSTRTSKIGFFKKININKKVIDISLASSHSAFLIDGGYVVTMGNNADGQRGLGHCKAVKGPTIVTGIIHKTIKHVRCCNSYTVVTSEDNIISFWGTRYGIPDYNFQLENDFNDGQPQPNTSAAFDVGNSTTAFTNFLTSVYKSELVSDPIDILALHSSKEQLSKGYYVRVGNVYPLPHSILVAVDTTTPLVSSNEH